MNQRMAGATIDECDDLALADVRPPDAAVKQDPIRPPEPLNGVRTGTLVGIAADSRVPLVTYAGQPGIAALRALSVVELSGQHIGRRVILMFEEGDPARPVILGCVCEEETSLQPHLDAVEVDADGQQLLIAARRRIVLRCGKASITLTCDGKVLLQGTYVSQRSAGVMRIRGGSVHIN